jgi:hypothetical protein
MPPESIEKSESVTDFERELGAIIEGEKDADSTKADDASEKKDLPSGDEPDDDDGSVSDDPPAATEDKPKADKTDSVEIADDLIERAVKAGIPLKDARAFTSPSALESIVSLLGGKKPSDDNSAEQDGNEPDSSDDLLAEFPELDPDDYDEKIIAGFNSMKNAIMKLVGENKSLSQKLASSAESDFLSGKIAATGQQAIAASGEIRRKFGILEAGYKAVGEKVSKDDIFSEALSMVVGDASASESKKAEAAAKRETQQLSRASNVSRKSKVDPEQEVIDTLDRKFFGKK